MNIAIYSRKSKFTGKGDSIENQIEMCTNYIHSHFDGAQILVYEDEGFTGANTDRPQFKRLLKDIESKKIEVLVCYRLDRISRNVADFSSTLEQLEQNDCAFVSIKEQFDTSTPMGRAMMYIASVFAQLERETIAERVRDNMLQLAKTGRWLGGNAPLGYSSEQLNHEDENGKNRKHYRLILNDDSSKVKYIFEKFLELGSLVRLQSYLIKNDVKSKSGKDYDLSSLRFILTNPVYLTADQNAYHYFYSKGCDICSDSAAFNGTKGILTYNRTNQSKKKTAAIKNDICDWIISIGEHEPIIESTKWIKVQNMMDLNSQKSFRKVHNQEALLAGLIRCGKCGSYMRPRRGRADKNGNYHYYYLCDLKEKSLGHKCDMKNIVGHKLDASIITQLKELSKSSSKLFEKVDKDKLKIEYVEDHISMQIKDLKSKISDNEQIIDNLLSSLGEAKESLASKYIIEKVNTLGDEISNLHSKIELLETQKTENKVKNINLSLKKDVLNYFADNIDSATIAQKREMIRAIIDEATWDGENLHLKIFGGKSMGEL